MNKEEKKDLIDSLKEASENGIEFPLDDRPDLERALIIGQLRNIKAILEKAKRKGLTDKALDVELEKYTAQRAKYLKEIEDKGFEYTEGEEDSDDYKGYAL